MKEEMRARLNDFKSSVKDKIRMAGCYIAETGAAMSQPPLTNEQLNAISEDKERAKLETGVNKLLRREARKQRKETKH